MQLRRDAEQIIRNAIQAAMPEAAVREALAGLAPPAGRLVLLSVGKAGYSMAAAASELLGPRLAEGLVITKHGHSRGDLPGIDIIEAGHPEPDENSFAAGERAAALAQGLGPDDLLLVLLSGGASALMESPLVTREEFQDINRQLLRSGADIVAMNTVRKRLSRVKGGRLAQLCAPAQVFCVVLSDIVGDPLDMIGSGPVYPDSSTSVQAIQIAARYGLQLSQEARAALALETPKELSNVTIRVTGSVSTLCRSAAETCRTLGYAPTVLSEAVQDEARAFGAQLARLAREHQDSPRSLAFIAGGETVVRVTGTGLGGRNQEVALAAAIGIAGCRNTCVFSVGSDGTDGPTDAAGGYVDGDTIRRLAELNLNAASALSNNDAYHALSPINGLIMTGPTGTNVNDLMVLLIRRAPAS